MWTRDSVQQPRTDDMEPDSSAPSTRPSGDGDALRWGLVAVLVAVGAVLAALGRYSRSYFPIQDDFALVWNSSHPYAGLQDMGTWVMEGYKNYFWNYPDWPSRGFAFSRPMANAAFYLQSLLQPTIGEQSYLLAGALGIVTLVLLVFVLLRRYTNMHPALACLFAIAVGVSPAWYEALFLPSFITNLLAAVFSAAALVVLDARRAVLSLSRSVMCSLMLVLAVLSHETAVVMAFVCAALVYGMARAKPKPLDLLPLAMPVVLVASLQVLLGGGRNYMLEGLEGTASFWTKLTSFVTDPLLPLAEYLSKPSPLGTYASLGTLVGVAINLFGVLLLVAYLKERPVPRRVALSLAVLASMVPAWMAPGQARFRGLTLLVGGVVLLYLMARAPRLRAAFVVSALAANLALFALFAVGDVDARAAKAADSREYFDYVSSSIRQTSPSTVVLLNDQQAMAGALAMLRLAAWPQEDTTLVVLNGLKGQPDPQAKALISSSEGVLTVENRLTPSQSILFAGCLPNPAVANQGFTYAPISGLENTPSFAARAPLRKGRTIVVGVNPQDGSLLRPVIIDTP